MRSARAGDSAVVPVRVNYLLYAPAAYGNDPKRRWPLIVFLHGLCMSERAWQKPAHAHFAEWARTHLAARVAYLRYNTGLRISANGVRLAELLEVSAR